MPMIFEVGERAMADGVRVTTFAVDAEGNALVFTTKEGSQLMASDVRKLERVELFWTFNATCTAMQLVDDEWKRTPRRFSFKAPTGCTHAQVMEIANTEMLSRWKTGGGLKVQR